MPIVYHAGRLIHFAHIPKCGGTSIEEYLSGCGVALGFLDRRYRAIPKHLRWNVSSPQHIDGFSMSRVIPPSFFSVGFSVVRNPIDRFLSAYQFQVNVEQTIDPNRDINTFIESELQYKITTLGFKDNHFLPQIRFFLPQVEYKIFKLENGLSHVKNYLDKSVIGFETNRAIGHEKKNKNLPPFAARSYLSDRSMEILQNLYESDFEKFDYS